jgi:hypothetical protein
MFHHRIRYAILKVVIMRGSSLPGKKHLLLLLASGAGEGVGDGLAGVGGHVLSLAEDALALVLGRVAAGAGGVAELLGGGLVALCGVVSTAQAR